MTGEEYALSSEKLFVSSGYLLPVLENESYLTCLMYVTSQNKDSSFPKSQPMGNRKDGFPIKDVGNDRAGDGLLRISFFPRLLVQGFCEEGVEEVVVFDFGGVELGFQLVAEGHKFRVFSEKSDLTILFEVNAPPHWGQVVRSMAKTHTREDSIVCATIVLSNPRFPEVIPDHSVEGPS